MDSQLVSSRLTLNIIGDYCMETCGLLERLLEITVIIYGILQCHEQNDSTGIYGRRNWYNYYAKRTIIIIFSSTNRMEWRFVQLTTTEYHNIAR